ncbi:MAG: hypothetical protein U5J97_06145 [Trueperaceae bacterium]|nr:hypothetical protein [Trueperaceae bacterium]
MIRARPPRPARSRPCVRSRDPSGVAVAAMVAATVTLAVALLLATSVALAGLQLHPDASRADRPADGPADPGLTATPTTLLWTAPVSSASAPASHHRLAGTVRRAAVTRPATPAGRHLLGSRGAVRTRAQRWFARRNLEGG